MNDDYLSAESVYDRTNGKTLADYNKVEILTITNLNTDESVWTTDSFNRVHAYKKNGMLFLNWNASIKAVESKATYISVAQINGWNAISEVFEIVPAQSNANSVIRLLIQNRGNVEIYFPSGSIASFYRTFICVPAVS